MMSYVRGVVLTGACLTVFVIPFSAHAQEVLTGERLEALYKEGAQIQKGSLQDMMVYVDKYLSDKSVTILHMITNIEGLPTQKQTLTLTKKDMLDKTKEGFGAVKIKNVENEIISLSISPDGKSAQVKGSTYATMDMHVPTPQGLIAFSGDQSMLCDDVVVLDNSDKIQIMKSVCSVELNAGLVR